MFLYHPLKSFLDSVSFPNRYFLFKKTHHLTRKSYHSYYSIFQLIKNKILYP